MKRTRIVSAIFMLFCFFIFDAYGQRQVKITNTESEHHGHISFIENKGQWENFIKFESEMRGGTLFFEPNKVTYLFADPDYLEKLQALKFSKNPADLPASATYYAYRMNFVGANESPVIEGQSPFADYINYYLGNDPKKWATEVKKYEKIQYKQLYKGIDLSFYEQYQTYKYEFVVESGANPALIRIEYEGAEKITLKNKNLSIKVGKHETVERSPVAYQLSENGEKKEIECRFVLEGKTVSFALEKYDNTQPLFIDPQIIFASYSGSTADNWGSTATFDNNGNLYGAGIVNHYLGGVYPTTLGAFQTVYGGDWDIAITKFNATGTQRLFSTYLGGAGADFPHSMIVNGNDELYIFATTSSLNFPTTAGAYNSTFNGGINTTPVSGVPYINGSDVVVSRFDSAGAHLLGSTYFGGSGNDGLNMSTSLAYNYADQIRGEIQLDASGNVYVASTTNSTNLPTKSSVFQPAYGGGSQDGFIAKFTSDLKNLIWCSYFGGSDADAIYSMEQDMAQNVYICGGTMSSNLQTSSGAISPSPPGNIDGFIAKIASNGSAVLASTYYGRNGYDQVYLIRSDKHDNIVVVGQTSTNASSWVSNAAWSNGNGQFISKLSNNLTQVIWSTSFGNADPGPNLSPSVLMVDLCGVINITGWGSTLGYGYPPLTLSGMPTSNNNFIQTQFDANGFYFMSIDSNASNLIFASTFGGLASHEHVDGGTSRYDKKGCVYQAVCAGCSRNSDFPTSPSNVVSTTNNSNNCNMGVIKMDFLLGTIVADFKKPDATCVGILVNYTNRSKEYSPATKYFWNFGDGTTDTAKNPSHVYLNPGTYFVTLIVTDTTGCNYADTLTQEIIIGSGRISFDTIPVCKGVFTKQIGETPSPTATYSWTPCIGLSDCTVANPIFRDTVSRTYMMIRTTSHCKDTVMQRVNVITMPKPKNSELTLCKGDTVRFAIDSMQMDTYIWSSNPRFTDTLNVSVTNPYLNIIVNQNATYYSFRKKAECEVRDTLRTKVSSFQLAFDPPPKTCSGDTIKLNVQVQNAVNGTNFTYRWQPAAAIVGSSQTNNPSAKPQKPMYYTVSVTNEHGCTVKDSVFVATIVLEPTIAINPISCYGMNDGSISIKMKGGNSPYSYHWFHTSKDTSLLKNLQKGLYRIQITDSNKCMIDTSMSIIEPSVLSLTLRDVIDTVFCDEICRGKALSVASGGTPPYSYNWITGDTTPHIDSLCAGKYTLWLKDSHGCKDTLLFDVIDTSSMNIDWTSEPTTCYNVCNGSVQIIVVEAVNPCRYVWKTGQTTDFANSLCRGYYDVSVTDAQHCTRRIFPNVGAPPPIVVDSSVIIHPYCHKEKGGFIRVHIKGGTPPYVYLWDGIQGTDSLSNLSETRAYRLTVTDSNGCTMDTALLLLDFDTLSIKYKTKNIPCYEVCNGSITVNAAGGVAPYTYLWTDSNHSVGSLIKDLCIGEYEVTAYDANLCLVKTIVPLIVDTTLFPTNVRAWSDLTKIYRSQSTTIHGSDYGSAFDYTWSPPDYLNTTKGTNAITTPLNTIIYTYKTTDTNGCEGTDTVMIIVMDVICEDPYIFVPNAFTPNGDGKNDILYVRGDVIDKIDFAIYDRWGEKLFETKDKNRGWDGTFRNRPCDPGVYVYYLDATCIGGTRYLHKGNITLIR